jgi:hypothetical protein
MGFSHIEQIRRLVSGGLTTGFCLSVSDRCSRLLSSIKKPHPSVGGLLEKFNQIRLSNEGKTCLRNHSVFGEKYFPRHSRKRTQLFNIRHLTEFGLRVGRGRLLEVRF